LCAALVVLSNACAGIIMPTATHTALGNMGRAAGSAAALLRGIQMIAGSSAGALVGLIGGDSLVAMALAMSVAAVLAIALLLPLLQVMRVPVGAAPTI
jgi:DHA1 family bicyclomycin/chloramphenicol resistance-like MFS transporter